MIRALLVAATLTFATPAFAQGNATDQADTDALLGVVTCPDGTNAPQERDDQRLVDNVMRAFQQASFPALQAYVPMLQAAMDHAPACYPEVERRGNRITMRTIDENQSMALALMLAATASRSNRHMTVARGPNPYMQIALLLGSNANENRQFEEALTWLDRGLALQPHSQYLIAEKSTALSQLGRKQEAHDLLRAEINNPTSNFTLDRARFERMDGVILIDLGQLDDAEAALNESIRLEPNNPIARSELTYIAQVRAGQATQGNSQMTAPNAPRPETQ